MPLIWADKGYKDAENDMMAKSAIDREFLNQVPEQLKTLFARYSVKRLTDALAMDPVPADVLRKALSFAYHCYNENDPRGAAARAEIQKTADELGVPELNAPESFFTSRFHSDQEVAHPNTSESVELAKAMHTAINHVSVASSWMLNGGERAWEGLVKAEHINPNYLGLQKRDHRARANTHYFLSWLQDLELCSQDIVLIDAYRDKIQLGFSHLYHLYNQENEKGQQYAAIVKTFMQHLDIPVLPVERLREQAVGWREDIHKRVNNPITNDSKSRL